MGDELRPLGRVYGQRKESLGKRRNAGKSDLLPVPYCRLFRFATTSDKVLLIIGVLAAAAAGLCNPLLIIFFGDITQVMIDDASMNASVKAAQKASGTPSKLWTRLQDIAKSVGVIGCGFFVLMYLFVTVFNAVAENQVNRLRRKYFEALLRQNVGWYDTVKDRSFVSRMSEDILKIEEAIGEKVGLCVFFLTMSLFSLGSAFWHGWKLTLVVNISAAPALVFVAGVVSTVQSKMVTDEQASYSKAGKVAEEAITNIRTVKAFGGQHKEVVRYAQGLKIAESAGKKRGLISAVGAGVMWLIIFATYALTFWYGMRLILEKDSNYTPYNLVIIFFSVLTASFNVGHSAKYFEAFATGCGAAASIFVVLDRNPEIDSFSKHGRIPKDRLSGKIEFRNINFAYPARPDVKVLKDFSLTIKPGQTVAFVGHSGGGKSTCIQLLQRFYDPLQGQVLVDNRDIRELQLEWLRSQLGSVGQEAVLFNTAISENIRYGRYDATDKEIQEAAIQANAHAFISKLPKGYQTLVGDRGAQLSGGQKQRVAIARAIIRECPILLLDEATSALDTQNEAIVQAALDRARKGRTTLIVAHRISTIRAADVIVSINHGRVEEMGSHVELMARKGLYFNLVTSQLAGHEHDETSFSLDAENAGDQGTLHGHEQPPMHIRDEEEEIVQPIASTLDKSLDDEKALRAVSIWRLLKLNAPEWHWITVGTLMAVGQGSVYPFYSIIFGDFLGSLADTSTAEKRVNALCLIFVFIGVGAGLTEFLQSFSFTISGEALTLRLRKLTFTAMLRQEPAWFDDSRNTIGALCARLSGDAAAVNGATGTRVGTLVQSLSTLCFAIGVGLYYIPKLGAVALAFVPVVIIATYYEGKLMHTKNTIQMNALEDASTVAVEAVSNIRTVASLCIEKLLVEIFCEKLVKSHKKNLNQAHIRGLTFGLAQSVSLFAYALVLYYGSYLIANEGIYYGDVFKVAEALVFGSMMIGHAMSFAPNYNKAKVSGARILGLLERKPAFQKPFEIGEPIKDAKGGVNFDKVAFKYPTRPGSLILKNLNFGVEPNRSIALVGPSGSGKSTIVQLILRFYDPINGTVSLDGTNIATLNVNSLRSVMAIVSQEPSLFDRTLRENIEYGDNSRTVTMEECINAAKLANIHNFIRQLPAQYETVVGEMGSQLSGGQKQRVAIARALVRSPRILLLDEATSALDSESEKIVQDALETAGLGRTTITIAHRLSSIQNSDQILVINNGSLVETGTHTQLLQQQGIYNQLWNMQGSLAS